MTNFFELTSDDLAQTSSFEKATFNNGDKPVMKIKRIAKKDVKGRPTIIVDNIVVEGEQTGKDYSMFYAMENAGARKALSIFLTTFMSAQEAAALTDPNSLIGKKFSCTMVETNGYLNPRYFKEESDVPAGLQVTPQQAASATPEPNAQTVDTTFSGQSLF